MATTLDVVILLVTKELDENILPEAVTLVDTILAALILVVTYTPKNGNYSRSVSSVRTLRG